MPFNNELHYAAKNGNLVQVQSQVRNFDINALGEDGGTALYWSARNGHANVVKLLLTFNPDVNIPNVSTLKMKFIHLIRISPIPLSLSYTLISTFLGIYCYHFNPIITLSSDFLLPHFLSFYQIITSFHCLPYPCNLSYFPFLISLRYSHLPSLSFFSIIPLRFTCVDLIATASSIWQRFFVQQP